METFRGVRRECSFAIEVRYAFADWDKIFLNPSIFMEYKFGIGDVLHDEGPPEPVGKGEAQGFINAHTPLRQALEMRVLLSGPYPVFVRP